MNSRSAAAKCARYGGKYLFGYVYIGASAAIFAPFQVLAAYARDVKRGKIFRAAFVGMVITFPLKYYSDDPFIGLLFPGAKEIHVRTIDGRHFEETIYFDDGSLSHLEV